MGSVKEKAGDNEDVMIFMFRETIMLRGVGTRDTMKNANVITKSFKGVINVFRTTICLQKFNGCIKDISNHII